MAESQYAVGDRVWVPDKQGLAHTATVLFVGTVPPTEGEWLGVEWDDVTRGKHDGLHEGTRYFTARGEKAGSFVRPRKTTSGVSAHEALLAKYDEKFDADTAVTELNLGTKGQAISVEIVGADKAYEQQSQLSALKEVYLQDTPIRTPGPEGALGGSIPSVQVLDLSKTLLSTWDDVCEITQQLPQLQRLRLCKNRLVPPSGSAAVAEVSGVGGGGAAAATTAAPAPLASLRSLFLNESIPTVAHLESLCLVTPLLPNLVELHLCTNGLTQLLGPPAAGSGEAGEAVRRRLELPATLELLNLEDNALTSWDDVVSVGHLARLSNIILSSNSIKEITAIPDGAFPSITHLSINSNQIDSWASIEALQGLPKLVDVRVRKNPLFEGKNGLWARQLTIARLATLTRLNGTDITERERLIAERFFLKENAQVYWSAKMNGKKATTDFLAEHALFGRLFDLHGEPDKPAAPATAIKDGFVALTGKLAADPAKEKTIQLPASTTVARLRQILKAKKVLTKEQSKAPIVYTDADGTKVELDDDLRELSFYDIKQGTVAPKADGS